MERPKVLRALVVTLEGVRWEINRVFEWDVTIDIGRVANRFVLDIANPNMVYTGIFGPGDSVTLYAEYDQGGGREVILSGYIDDIEEAYAPDRGGIIRLDGRDNGVFILENDAVPTTHKTITLKDMASRIFGEFDMPFKYDGPTISIDGKQIRIGANGWDTVEEHALENDLRLYRIDGTVYCGKFKPLSDYTYTFTDVPTNPKEIPYMTLRRRISGANRKREVWAYSTGKGRAVVKEIDSTLPEGFRRRAVISGAKTLADTKKAAKEKMARTRMGSNEVELTVMGTRFVRAGRKSKILSVHGIRDYNLEMVIASVRYSYTSTGGETTTITLRPESEVLG